MLQRTLNPVLTRGLHPVEPPFLVSAGGATHPIDNVIVSAVTRSVAAKSDPTATSYKKICAKVFLAEYPVLYFTVASTFIIILLCV